MEIDKILRFLENSGIHVQGVDNSFIYFDDPSCIYNAFDTFLNYAWVVIVILTVAMLSGWAILYIKNGVKINDLFHNAKVVLLIFAIFSAVKPIVNFVYGDDLFGRNCEVKKVSLTHVQELIKIRDKTLSNTDENSLYEVFEIEDSGMIYNSEDDLGIDEDMTFSYDTYGESASVYNLDDEATTQGSRQENLRAYQSMLQSAQNQEKTITNIVGGAQANQIAEISGVSALRKISSLSAQEKRSVAYAMAQTMGNSSSYRTNSSYSNAKEVSKFVIYTKPNGEKVKRSGGSVAWRHNNPGNIINSKFALAHGALKSSGKFAVFPDEKTGMQAIKSLLRSKSYSSLSIDAAIHKWAPAADNNNPKRYVKGVVKRTGLSANRKISSLSDQELNKFANAIRATEGWKPGEEQRV